MKAINFNLIQSWRFGELARFRLKHKNRVAQLWQNQLWRLWRRIDRLEVEHHRAHSTERTLESLKANQPSLSKWA